jgi:hypothetical protein
MGTIFFYSNEEDSAAIATLSPTAITTTLTLGKDTFSKWTHVVASGEFILFYDRHSGKAAIGKLAAGNFTTIQEWDPGAFSAWTHIVSPAWVGSFTIA